MSKSFQLIRTNPRLTTNLKIVVDSSYNIYMESFDTNKELSDQKFKHVSINKNTAFEDSVPAFYDGLPKNIAYDIKNDQDYDIMYNTYDKQFDSMYFAGAAKIEDQWYDDEFEYLAPLYVNKGKLPSHFIILRNDDPVLLTMDSDDYSFTNTNAGNFKDNIVKKWKCVSLIDLTNNNNGIGSFLNKNVTKNSRFPNNSLYFDVDNKIIKWIGMDYKTGVYTEHTKDISSLITYEQPHFYFENYITTGFQDTGIIYPHIMNFKFLFNDSPATPDKYKKYSINRYSGFYVDDLELIKTVTSCDLEELTTTNTAYIKIKNNMFVISDSSSDYKAVCPFKNTTITSAWASYNNEYFEIRKLDNGFYKILTSSILDGVKITEFNQNLCTISYSDSVNTVVFNNDVMCSYQDIIDGDNKLSATHNMYGDLYLIKINDVYHILTKEKSSYNKIDNEYYKYNYTYTINSDYAIVSNNKELKYWKGGESNKITIDVKSSSGKPLTYNIYRVKFCDVKDFDFDRVDSRYGDFDYEKEHYYDTPEQKLSALEYRDITIPITEKVHDKTTNGQYKKMNISSEYIAGDEFHQINTSDLNYPLNDIWAKNQSVCKWGYKGSIGHSDYPYKLNLSYKVGGKYNRCTNTDYLYAESIEKTHDYFYRYGSLFSKESTIYSGITSTYSTDWTLSETTYFTYNSLNNTLTVATSSTIVPTMTYKNTLDIGYHYFEMNIDALITYTPLSESYIKIGYVSNNTETNLIYKSIRKSNSTTDDTDNLIVCGYFYSDGKGQIRVSFRRGTYIINSLKIYVAPTALYNNQTTNIQTDFLPINITDGLTNSKNIVDFNKVLTSIYLSSNYDYFSHIMKNNMYYSTTNGKGIKQYNKYATFNNGDSSLPSKTLFKGIEYSIYSVNEMVIDSNNNITNVITSGGEKYNDYKFSVLLTENYKKYNSKMNTASSSASASFGTSTYNLESNVDTTLSSDINVYVNDIYKNILIIINVDIDINSLYGSFNNVDYFTETSGLYLNALKCYVNNTVNPIIENSSESYKLSFHLTESDGGKPYVPNSYIAKLYMDKLNSLTDINVSYHIIDSYGKKGSFTFGNYTTSTMKNLTGWNYNYPPFYIKVNGASEIKLDIDSYSVSPIKGPTTNVYDKFAIYSNNKPISETIIDQPLSRSLKVGETVSNNRYSLKYSSNIGNEILIKRFSGFYEPIYHEIPLFKKNYIWGNNTTNGIVYDSILDNYEFDTDLSNFGQIREIPYSKTNEYVNCLKLKDDNDNRSIYPMIDEIALSFSDRFVFKSQWDDYYIKTLDEHIMEEYFIQMLSTEDIDITVNSFSLDGYTSGKYIMAYATGFETISFTISITNNADSSVSLKYLIDLYVDMSDNYDDEVESENSVININSNTTSTFNITMNRPAKGSRTTVIQQWNARLRIADAMASDYSNPVSTNTIQFNVFNNNNTFSTNSFIVKDTSGNTVSTTTSLIEGTTYTYGINVVSNSSYPVTITNTFYIRTTTGSNVLLGTSTVSFPTTTLVSSQYTSVSAALPVDSSMSDDTTTTRTFYIQSTYTESNVIGSSAIVNTTTISPNPTRPVIRPAKLSYTSGSLTGTAISGSSGVYNRMTLSMSVVLSCTNAKYTFVSGDIVTLTVAKYSSSDTLITSNFYTQSYTMTSHGSVNSGGTVTLSATTDAFSFDANYKYRLIVTTAGNMTSKFITATTTYYPSSTTFLYWNRYVTPPALAFNDMALTVSNNGTTDTLTCSFSIECQGSAYTSISTDTYTATIQQFISGTFNNAVVVSTAVIPSLSLGGEQTYSFSHDYTVDKQYQYRLFLTSNSPQFASSAIYYPSSTTYNDGTNLAALTINNAALTLETQTATNVDNLKLTFTVKSSGAYVTNTNIYIERLISYFTVGATNSFTTVSIGKSVIPTLAMNESFTITEYHTVAYSEQFKYQARIISNSPLFTPTILSTSPLYLPSSSTYVTGNAYVSTTSSTTAQWGTSTAALTYQSAFRISGNTSDSTGLKIVIYVSPESGKSFTSNSNTYLTLSFLINSSAVNMTFYSYDSTAGAYTAITNNKYIIPDLTSSDYPSGKTITLYCGYGAPKIVQTIAVTLTPSGFTSSSTTKSLT